MPVIPNMMPTSPLAASHKNLLKTLNQGKVAAGRNKRQPSDSSDEEEGIVERRVSVRQSESAFRYKEIVVKKCPGYTQIWLFTSTKIKNSLNPKVSNRICIVMCSRWQFIMIIKRSPHYPANSYQEIVNKDELHPSDNNY